MSAGDDRGKCDTCGGKLVSSEGCGSCWHCTECNNFGCSNMSGYHVDGNHNFKVLPDQPVDIFFEPSIKPLRERIEKLEKQVDKLSLLWYNR